MSGDVANEGATVDCLLATAPRVLEKRLFRTLQLELTPILRSLPSREDAEAVEEAKRRAMAEARAMRAEGEVKEARATGTRTGRGRAATKGTAAAG